MKKRWLWIALSLLLIVLGYFGYRNYSKKQQQKAYLAQGKSHAKQHCSSCHLFPEPDLLTKDLWNTSVLPNMGSRLGMKGHFDFFYPHVGYNGKPVLSQEDWDILVYYYLMNAPDSLQQVSPEKPIFESTLFKSKPYCNITGGIVTTLMHIDHSIFIADAIDSSFHIINLENFTIKSQKFGWPITDVKRVNQALFLTSPGYLHPADHQMGMVLKKETMENDPKIVIDSLRRALRTSISDFDQNGLEDLLICEFGHSLGQLSLYFNSKTGYKRKILASTPGAICAQIHDFNQDGLDDFMVLFAQGDERLVLYTNMGNQQFLPETVYRFPSVYGSLYFELADFNMDGLPDILYTNGDNGDYTPIPKPYHGVRILLNRGNNQFEETWFYPMNGAAMAKAHDFDQDGTLDIIATANFTRSGKPEKEGLLFFHHEDYLKFKPFIFKNGDLNQWNLLEIVDVDMDGDKDVLVGAMNIDAILRQQANTGEPQLRNTSILMLENQTIQGNNSSSF
jgi:hypothetical protein